jgi:signal transduction histidine kinase
VTALGRFFRTTTFKLTLVYLTFFAIFGAFLLGYFAFNTRRLVTEQITQTVDAELTGLVDQYNQGGVRRLVIVVEARSRNPGSSLYLVTTPTSEGLAGNVGSLPAGEMNNPGWSETQYRRLDEGTDGPEHRALVRIIHLPNHFRVLVGRDLEEREHLFGIVVSAGRWSLAIVVILGLFGGFIVTRRLLRRVDAMTGTTRTIMLGDLSGRLPVSGTGDELDRLAANLNAMLERIEGLMQGMREVSDNIAHDLKTPLTRLRNRCEDALRTARTPEAYRDALERTIEESDGLILTFNALLSIARAESGHAREGMTDFDAAEVVGDVCELYEPVADEQGLILKVNASQPIPFHGNRELVGQALANLVDNAIKYAGPSGDAAQKADTPAAEIVMSAETADNQLIIAVADRGPGIADADRVHVVERFVRLEQSRSKPGSGLGLSLAAAVARLHGGELRLEDNAPGLKVMMLLPFSKPNPAPPIPAAT